METENNNSKAVNTEEKSSLFDKLSNSIVLKLLVILILVLFLLIPMSWVKDLISERNHRERSVATEVASKWGTSQVVSGPIIGIPYMYEYTSTWVDDKGKNKSELVVEKDYVFLAANNQKVVATVNPEYLKRGIYQAVVYNAEVALSGDFGEVDLAHLELKPEMLLWDQAKVFIGLSDLKGLQSVPQLNYAGKQSAFQTSNGEVSLFERTMAADIDLTANSTAMKFTIGLDVRGSKSLTVFPTGNETAIEVGGKWANPSFNGGFLPEERTVGEQDFTASWRIPSFSRKFPQQWKGNTGRLYSISNPEGSLMGEEYYAGVEAAQPLSGVSSSDEGDMVQVNFLEAMNNYQKTSRVAKYGILVILLTFTSLLFTEIVKKKRVHIIQYVLIGCAMVLFYSLLLAIGEHVGFNLSYLISAVATVVLIATFIYSITKDKKTGLLFSGILGLFYAFIFFLLQLQDYALLVGTIGVFIILAVLMRFSTRIDWYQFERKAK